MSEAQVAAEALSEDPDPGSEKKDRPLPPRKGALVVYKRLSIAYMHKSMAPVEETTGPHRVENK